MCPETHRHRMVTGVCMCATCMAETPAQWGNTHPLPCLHTTWTQQTAQVSGGMVLWCACIVTDTCLYYAYLRMLTPAYACLRLLTPACLQLSPPPPPHIITCNCVWRKLCVARNMCAQTRDTTVVWPCGTLVSGLWLAEHDTVPAPIVTASTTQTRRMWVGAVAVAGSW